MKMYLKSSLNVKMFFTYARRGAPVQSLALLSVGSVTVPEVVERVCACMDMSEERCRSGLPSSRLSRELSYCFRGVDFSRGLHIGGLHIALIVVD